MNYLEDFGGLLNFEDDFTWLEPVEGKKRRLNVNTFRRLERRRS